MCRCCWSSGVTTPYEPDEPDEPDELNADGFDYWLDREVRIEGMPATVEDVAFDFDSTPILRVRTFDGQVVEEVSPTSLDSY